MQHEFSPLALSRSGGYGIKYSNDTTDPRTGTRHHGCRHHRSPSSLSDGSHHATQFSVALRRRVVNVTTVVATLTRHHPHRSVVRSGILSTMIIGGICEIRTSMLSLIMDSIRQEMCLTEGF